MPQQLHAHRRGFLEIANKLQGDTHGMERTKRDSGYCDLATWGIGNHSSSEPSLNTKDASPGDQTDIPDWNHHEDAVLPCVRREDISRGGFGCIWQIAIHSEHQRILSGGQDVGGPAPTMKRLFTPIVCDCSVTSRNSATSVFARKVHFRDHFRDYYWEDLALKQTQQYGTRSYWHRGTGSPRLIGALNLGSTLGMGGTYLWLNKTMRLEPPTESMQWIIEKTCNLIPSFLHDLPDFPDWAIFILFAASTVSFTGTTFLWASNRVQKPIAKVLACMVATLGMIACMLAGFGAEEILLVGIPLSISMGILANFVVRYRTDEQKEWKEEKRGLVLEV
ncbi:hypothetical protein IFR05_014009 [Cadophora sp. M221]|nr:hypothetical protein IFR05_014009 [Cadophora sp. M221]